MKQVKKLIIASTLAATITPMSLIHTMRPDDTQTSPQEIADINTLDRQGYTPLINAIRSNRTQRAKELIEMGADVNLAGKGGITPLLAAVKADNLYLVRLLIDAKANINQPDYVNTPLFLSTRNNYDAISQLLLRHGATVDIETYGSTSLINAINQKASIETIEMILNNSTPRLINMKTNDVSNAPTLLLSAITDCNMKLITLLINHGANVNDKTITGDYINDAANKHFCIDTQGHIRAVAEQKCLFVSELIELLILAGATHIREDEKNNNVINAAIKETLKAKKLLETYIPLEDPASWQQLPAEFVNAMGTDIMKLIIGYYSENPAITKEIERRKKARALAQEKAMRLGYIDESNQTPTPRPTPKAAASSAQASQNKEHKTASIAATIACAICTFANRPEAQNCEICTSPLTAQAPAKTGPTTNLKATNIFVNPDEIICPACSLINKIRFKKCTMCKTPFPPADDNKAPETPYVVPAHHEAAALDIPLEQSANNQIACACCTYLNPARARQCEICSTPLRNF